MLSKRLYTIQSKALFIDHLIIFKNIYIYIFSASLAIKSALKEEQSRFKSLIEKLRIYLSDIVTTLTILWDLNLDYFLLFDIHQINMDVLHRDHFLTAKTFEPSNLILQNIQISKTGIFFSQAIESSSHSTRLLQIVQQLSRSQENSSFEQYKRVQVFKFAKELNEQQFKLIQTTLPRLAKLTFKLPIFQDDFVLITHTHGYSPLGMIPFEEHSNFNSYNTYRLIYSYLTNSVIFATKFREDEEKEKMMQKLRLPSQVEMYSESPDPPRPSSFAPPSSNAPHAECCRCSKCRQKGDNTGIRGVEHPGSGMSPTPSVISEQRQSVPRQSQAFLPQQCQASSQGQQTNFGGAKQKLLHWEKDSNYGYTNPDAIDAPAAAAAAAVAAAASHPDQADPLQAQQNLHQILLQDREQRRIELDRLTEQRDRLTQEFRQVDECVSSSNKEIKKLSRNSNILSKVFTNLSSSFSSSKRKDASFSSPILPPSSNRFPVLDGEVTIQSKAKKNFSSALQSNLPPVILNSNVQDKPADARSDKGQSVPEQGAQGRENSETSQQQQLLDLHTPQQQQSPAAHSSPRQLQPAAVPPALPLLPADQPGLTQASSPLLPPSLPGTPVTEAAAGLPRPNLQSPSDFTTPSNQIKEKTTPFMSARPTLPPKSNRTKIFRSSGLDRT